jgi:hypothetical protein
VYAAARRSLSPAATGFVQILERFAQKPGLAG